MSGANAGRKHQHAPPVGEHQPLAGRPTGPRRPRRLQAGGGSGFVNVNQRLFAPLQSLDPNNILQGGYGWLDITDGGMTYHPGYDLNAGGSCNADEGLLVVTPLAGVVRSTQYWNGSTPGEGNHVWVELDDPCLPGPTWLHIDHLSRITVSVDQRLAPGEPFGQCGRSGGWDCAHAHTELLTGPPQDGWWQWPYGWSRAKVEAAYWSPSAWWSAATALVLAEGNQPITPEVVVMLEDWQVKGWILAPLYREAGIDYNPDSGTAQAWVDRLRADHYAGRPRSAEQPYGEGDERGVWVEFDRGVCLYRLRDGQTSWNG